MTSGKTRRVVSPILQPLVSRLLHHHGHSHSHHWTTYSPVPQPEHTPLCPPNGTSQSSFLYLLLKATSEVFYLHPSLTTNIQSPGPTESPSSHCSSLSTSPISTAPQDQDILNSHLEDCSSSLLTGSCPLSNLSSPCSQTDLFSGEV